MTLQEIKEFAMEHNVFPDQIDKFIELLETGDEVQAWQTVLGNSYYLEAAGCDLSGLELRKLANGVAKVWRKNGNLRGEGTYNGQDVTHRRWFENGQLANEYNTVNGKKHGLYRHWHEDGKLWIEEHYLNDKRHGLSREWSDGESFVEQNYANGYYHGLHRSYDNNGKVWSEYNYCNNKLHGLYRQWHSNGQSWIEEHYLNGKRHGLSREWDENGELISEFNYINGELVK